MFCPLAALGVMGWGGFTWLFNQGDYYHVFTLCSTLGIAYVGASGTIEISFLGCSVLLTACSLAYLAADIAEPGAL
jgi:hypothetical protein